jgi:hypothetical protein
MSQATTRIGRRSDIAASDVSLWVNQAYQDFVREVPELLSERTHYFSVNSGTSVLSLPADFYEEISISLSTREGGATLRRLSPEFCDSQGYFPLGEPEGFFIFGDQVQLWPSANSSTASTVWSGRSYLMRYRAVPTDMSATTAVPSVATQHRVGILFKAEQYLHELVGNYEEAANSGLRYTTFVMTLKDAIARRQADRNRHAISLPPGGTIRRSDADLDDADEWRRY